ncbi:hypothetical protein FBZ98_1011023 [Rhizobium sp. ERR 922]|nr:hypothetical protein FBZ98_1011023 [Rhizobium sp. ERR 922]TWC04604.1 hypothetical protein FBZ97_1011023 [Rhizobium sp. ERR 942]
MPTIKNATPHFRTNGLDDGTPFIALERYTGDSLSMFDKTIRLRLPTGTSVGRAKEIREFLANNIISIDEIE